jgi:hypothetical protein
LKNVERRKRNLVRYEKRRRMRKFEEQEGGRKR